MWQWLLAASLAVPVSTYGHSTADRIEVEVGEGSPNLSFCQLRFYEEERGLLLCNWAVNFNRACFVSHPSNIIIRAGSAIAEPEVVGRCENDEPVIKLFHY